MEAIRCPWATRSTFEKQYHDTEWGIPLHDDQQLFELLILEGMQAGLSWTTIISKREGMREAFDGFNPHIIALYTEKEVEALLNNPNVIRNRLKIQATVSNAKAYLALVETHGSLNDFMWSYVNHEPIINHFSSISEVPSQTELSVQISKQLKRLGFKFVGPTTIYAYMQATGMVNDHLVTCMCHPNNKGELK